MINNPEQAYYALWGAIASQDWDKFREVCDENLEIVSPFVTMRGRLEFIKIFEPLLREWDIRHECHTILSSGSSMVAAESTHFLMRRPFEAAAKWRLLELLQVDHGKVVSWKYMYDWGEVYRLCPNELKPYILNGQQAGIDAVRDLTGRTDSTGGLE